MIVRAPAEAPFDYAAKFNLGYDEFDEDDAENRLADTLDRVRTRLAARPATRMEATE